MSINIELMRKKLAQLRGEDAKDQSVWFKPEDGVQDIRILPTPDGDPLRELSFHYNVGNHTGGILCPKRNFGDTCPICEFASSLWKDGTASNDEESKKLAKSLFVRSRFFSPIIVRGQEDEGVKIYGYGKRAYENLLGYILDPDYGDITDVKEGTDITLTYTKPTQPGAFPQTSLKPRRSSSPLLDDPDAVAALLDGIPDLDALFERHTTEQINAILDEQLASDGSAESRSKETTRYSDDKNDVDRAFDELMANK